MGKGYRHPNNFEIMEEARKILDDGGNSATRDYVNAVLSFCYARGFGSQGSPFRETVSRLSEKYGYEPPRYF